MASSFTTQPPQRVASPHYHSAPIPAHPIHRVATPITAQPLHRLATPITAQTPQLLGWQVRLPLNYPNVLQVPITTQLPLPPNHSIVWQLQ